MTAKHKIQVTDMVLQNKTQNTGYRYGITKQNTKYRLQIWYYKTNLVQRSTSCKTLSTNLTGNQER